MAADEESIIGTHEAAEILGWSKRKVQRHANTGQIPIVGHVGPQQNLLFERTTIEELAHHAHDA